MPFYMRLIIFSTVSFKSDKDTM